MKWWEQDRPAVAQAAVESATWWEKDAPARQEEKTSRLESGARGALQGATLGFSDEIVGGLAAAGGALLGDFNISDNYARARDTIRGGDRRAQAANPGSFLAGEIAGGVALPFGVAKAATKLPQMGQTLARVAGLTPEATQAASLGQRVGQGATMGAAYGGLYGAGMSEADNAGDLTLDALIGAGTGLVVGGVAVPAVDFVSAAGRAVAAPVRAWRNPKGFAAEKAEEAAQRDLKDGLRMAYRARVATKADPDTMIADLGGRSTKRLMRAALNQQSPRAETFNLRLDQRAGFQSNKIERGIRDKLNLGADDYFQSVDDVSARLKEIGEEGFQPALKVETPMTPELAAIFKRPTAQRLLQHVQTSLADEGKAIGFETRTEALHRVKIELNKLIRSAEDAQKKGGATGWDVNSLRTIKRDLMEAWDNEAYKNASRLYADEAALKTASERGFDDFLQQPWQEVKKTMSELSDAEKSMYRRGAVEALMTRIREGNPLGDKVGKIGADNMKNRLRQLFPDHKEWREFQRLLVTLSRQNKTRAAAQGNSTTAQQLSDMTDATNMTEAAKTAANAATGNWRGILDTAGKFGNRLLGLTPEVADEILRILGTRPAGTEGATTFAGRRAMKAFQTPETRAASERLARGQERRNAFARGVTSGVSAPLVGGFGPNWER